MPTIEIESNAGVRLTQALLIYEEDGGGDVVITRHQIKNGVIQPGAPLDTASFCKLIESGKGKAATTWAMQFPRMLGESPEYMAWWSRPQVQHVFIGQDHRKAKPVEAWVPGLVWIAARGRPACMLRAFDGDDAPTMNTDLYHPVFGNHIHADGSICVGTMTLPDYLPVSWERGFWGSCFSQATNLNKTTPYACKKAFKKVGTLASVLPHRPPTH